MEMIALEERESRKQNSRDEIYAIYSEYMETDSGRFIVVNAEVDTQIRLNVSFLSS